MEKGVKTDIFKGARSKRLIAVIIIDLLILLELGICIYISSLDPNTMVITFLKLYIPIVILTLIVGRFFLRIFR